MRIKGVMEGNGDKKEIIRKMLRKGVMGEKEMGKSDEGGRRRE